jgi:uncharacterized protein YbjT (DUF2867 family)
VLSERTTEERGPITLVTGATGNIGAEVVAALQARGRTVRALVHRVTAAPTPEVTPMPGDLEADTNFGRAVAGVDSVFVLGSFTAAPTLIRDAEAAGVRAVVVLSTGAVTGDPATRRDEPRNIVVRQNLASERAAALTRVDATILRPSGFHSNVRRWLPNLQAGDVVEAPFGGVPIASVDPADIGEVAALALVDRGHDGGIYRLTGPEPLVPAEQVAILGQALKRELCFRGQSDEVALAEMGRSLPNGYAQAFRDFFVDGSYNDARVLDTVRNVTGRPPRSFELWVASHVDEFR